MDLLVAEETVGYGPRLEVDSTSPRHLSLVPVMHQIHRKAEISYVLVLDALGLRRMQNSAD